ncbi:DUF1573 domain-containing protein [Chryseobacterium sp. POL2]|uniref:DUF1573 domain-containing protein n=1 Tax=Chryseobacterium sp. POL2 TaxID=2713414 RepID=UPI0013E186DB|nr:DUF1573 domain-containing protein [Chryseobacterium sp. POL2]QIG90423.1 DUF1573 domain-containing protein [Chryseobacterium sp. POL2]
MKKSFKYLAIAAMAISIVACKKKDDTTLVADNSSAVVENQAMDAVVDEHAGHDHATEEDAMLEEAKKNPLTTVALKESDFSFGKIKKGDIVEHIYEITNTGTNPLIISSVKPGCGCTAPDYTKEPILPGKSGKITLKFDSSSFDGNVAKAADIYANVEKAPIRIGFTAEITN